MKCLVSKLSAEVNNPNLPVLETIQQITLDAIARGGNMQLTDEKKHALNHFFYLMGAVNQSTLWNKVSYLMLPIIGVGKTGVLVEHKRENNSLNVTSSYVIDQSGVLQLNIGGNTTAAPFLNPVSGWGLKDKAYAYLSDLSSNNYIFNVGANGASSQNEPGGIRAKLTIRGNNLILPISVSIDSIYGKIINGTETELQHILLTTDGEKQNSVLFSDSIFAGYDFSGSENAVNISTLMGYPAFKVIVIFNAGLTNDEVITLKEAFNGLYESF